MLFDIGIAGPIAGFVVAVPALFIGHGMSHVVPRAAGLRAASSSASRCSSSSASWLIWARSPDGYSVNMHPMAFAAWFGMLATALNLFPIGQLDGGHISYAVLGRRSSYVTLGDGRRRRSALTLLLAAAGSSGRVLMVGDAVRLRPRTIRATFDEHVPLDRARLVARARSRW